MLIVEERPKPYEEERPWGAFRQFSHNEETTVKILTVHRGQQNSLQTHNHRDEFWHVISGELDLTIGEEVHNAKTGDEFWISRGTRHRLNGVGGNNRVLEISYGHFDEDDIVRLEDNYGRT